MFVFEYIRTISMVLRIFVESRNQRCSLNSAAESFSKNFIGHI